MYDFLSVKSPFPSERTGEGKIIRLQKSRFQRVIAKIKKTSKKGD